VIPIEISIISQCNSLSTKPTLTASSDTSLEYLIEDPELIVTLTVNNPKPECGDIFIYTEDQGL